MDGPVPTKLPDPEPIDWARWTSDCEPVLASRNWTLLTLGTLLGTACGCGSVRPCVLFSRRESLGLRNRLLLPLLLPLPRQVPRQRMKQRQQGLQRQQLGQQQRLP